MNARKMTALLVGLLVLLAVGIFFVVPHGTGAPTASQVLGTQDHPVAVPSKKKFLGNGDF